MPNNFSNTLIVKGGEMNIRQFIDENAGEHSLTFTKSVPIPTDLSPENLLEWKIRNWGSSSDIDSKDNLSIRFKPTQHAFWFKSTESSINIWVKHVSVLYPDLEFSLHYGVSSYLVVKNGEIICEICDEDWEFSDEDSQPDSVS